MSGSIAAAIASASSGEELRLPSCSTGSQRRPVPAVARRVDPLALAARARSGAARRRRSPR